MRDICLHINKHFLNLSDPERYKYYNSNEYQKYIRAERNIICNKTQQKEVEDLKFVNDEHRTRLAMLLARTQVAITNTRVVSFFYIVTSNDYLYERIDALFNFFTREIDKECLFNGIVPLDTQEWQLLDIGIALYDEGFPVDLYTCFAGLDGARLEVALEALRIRFVNV